MPLNLQKLKLWLSAGQTTLRKYFGLSDRKTWQNLANFYDNWDIRTQQIATLIQPGQSVLEFGAGRMSLKNHLPEGCCYTPSDLVDRGGGTLVCDLNAKRLPTFPIHDVMVFGGVLEYIHDVPRLVAHISPFTHTVIVSYVSTRYFAKILNRRSLGWVNDYTPEELIAVFEKAGFTCEEMQDFYTKNRPSQQIYKFISHKGA